MDNTPAEIRQLPSDDIPLHELKSFIWQEKVQVNEDEQTVHAFDDKTKALALLNAVGEEQYQGVSEAFRTQYRRGNL